MTGDAVFDPAFVVKGSDEQATRKLLNDRARRAMQAFPETTGFAYDRGVFTCRWSGWDVSPEVLARAIEVAIGLCGA